ncbi:leucine-rich repeat-containing protein 71 isoform X3 [Gallus gallus]|uniref:leucine-rich repeat-containing protein 71 isoform X3 n=1 Tax=Gallus gallus TaxID=9031 RepID=UPI001AE461A9|nr:leucine-rich repeat-containing protein 71 isoform X3 [Gallus gallus]XP_040546942.1 leucine-rich repeat-containing protein 71 isoform X3 [Gallus gallus]
MEKELRAEQAAEQYQCCGLLQQDLTELCARAGIISIPRVTVRPFPAAGWKVEEEMLGVLSKCLPALGNLKTLNLWSTGLTDCMLPALGTMVASCSQLWSLTLEGNPLPENSFHVLMGASSTLSHLSLRNNCIDDTAAQLLGQGLSTMSSSNHSLLSLVLSFNCISDVGAGHIAEVPVSNPITFLIPSSQGLRWNRSLLSLSLAHNRIGDIGAQKLAEVLQPFKLRHEEVVERRRLLMEAQGQPRAAAPSGGYAPSLRGSDAAVRLSPAKQSKSTTKKKERLRKEDVKQSKKLTAPSDPRPGRSRGTKGVSEEKQSTQALHPAEPTHPLLEPGLHRDGHVILPGNRVLLNLNLAHNRITERGLGALLAAVEGQQQQEGAGGQQGLRRLSLHRNSFPTACAAFTRLQELLQQRDPLPQPAEDEEEHSLEP